jgi:radical SAM family uncharacterized protein
VTTLSGRINAILPRVTKPARYTGGEWNIVSKDHSRVSLKVAWVFPDTYEVGMSHLGSQIMYHQINRRVDALCERAYAPWPDMERAMRAAEVPLFTLESWTPVGAFDLLAFPLLYELTFTNIFTCLDLAGVPIHSKDRTEAHPLVIAGGPCAFNCEPLAPYLDLVVLGDGEQVIHQILDTYKAWSRSEGRRELLRRLARITGCYVPAFYEPKYNPDGIVRRYQVLEPGAPAVVERAIVPDLDAVDFPMAQVVPNTEIIFDRAQVEVFRGCTRGCRFCHAGMVTRPVRERSQQRVIELARAAVAGTGYDDVSLVSLSTADYTAVQETVELLSPEMQCLGVNVTLPSTRVDGFSVALADGVGRMRKGSVTLAPEAGSARMRRVINKTVSDRDIREAFRAAFLGGYRAIKLYFMVGLPTETDADLAGIAEKGRWALAVAEEVLGRKDARRVRVTISVSVFVPKAHTPFQFEPQPAPEEISRRLEYLGRQITDPRIAYKYHPAATSQLEALLSVGDRRVAPALLRAWELGCRFDGWNECLRQDLWEQACAETGVDIAFHANRRKGYGELFAWSHLSTGITPDWLIADHMRAMQETEVADCRWESCDICGACMELGVQTVLKGGGAP